MLASCYCCWLLLLLAAAAAAAMLEFFQCLITTPFEPHLLSFPLPTLRGFRVQKDGQEVDPDAVDMHTRPFKNAVRKLQELKEHYPLRVMGLSANSAAVSIISSIMIYSISALLYGFVLNSEDGACRHHASQPAARSFCMPKTSYRGN
jgi:hypothetical protein